MISHERLLETYDYDPISGSLIWKTSKHKLEGKIAGHLNKILNRWYVLLDGKQVPRSRVIHFYMTGEFPHELEIRHLNKDASDDRWENLAIGTRQCKRPRIKKLK